MNLCIVRVFRLVIFKPCIRVLFDVGAFITDLVIDDITNRLQSNIKNVSIAFFNNILILIIVEKKFQ